MKSIPTPPGDTIPGGLGPALPPPPKPWGKDDERRKRREIEESQQGGAWGIIVGPDGKMETTKNPPPDEWLK
jgi:hypothetical protein